MATYTDIKFWRIIEAFKELDVAFKKMEDSLAEIDIDEYKLEGKVFIQNMCCFHNWISDPFKIYRSDVAEAESALNPKTEIKAISGIEDYAAMRPAGESTECLCDEYSSLILDQRKTIKDLREILDTCCAVAGIEIYGALKAEICRLVNTHKHYAPKEKRGKMDILVESINRETDKINCIERKLKL